MRLVAAFAVLGMMLLFAGCATKEADAEKNETAIGKQGEIGNPAMPKEEPDSQVGILPGSVPIEVVGQPAPEEPKMGGVDRGLNTTENNASAAPNATAVQEIPKQIILKDSFNDTEYGVYFKLPEGTEVFTTGCSYWGGSRNCEMIGVWDAGGEKFVELSGQKYDFSKTLRETLDKSGALKRDKSYLWFTAKFGGREAYIREIDNATEFSRALYTLLGGKMVGFEVSGSRGGMENARAIWESLRIGGNRAKDYYPVEYSCIWDGNCYQGEICYHKTFCVNINASDTDLRNYFNSTSVCSSSGQAYICKRECQFDSDCLKGQQCFTLRRDDGATVQKFTICT